MKFIYLISVISTTAVFSCGVQNTTQKDSLNIETMADNDSTESALDFSKYVLNDSLRIIVHDRVVMGYWDIQMIFEADDFRSDHFNTYTTYSNMQNFDKSVDGDYDGIILFAATYKDVPSAQHAFQVLKTRTQIRAEDLEGQAGLRVEQVRIFERIRTSGGLFVQKDKYVFYLLESCETPPVCESWNEYENLFLSFITEKNEEIEIINADCEKDEFVVQKIIASR